MKRLYEDLAYGNGPIKSCFWKTSGPQTQFAPLSQNIRCDIAIIGAGFTGISAAYHLAQKGVSSVLLDAEQPLFGATGRNGGFCCGGGALTTDRHLDRHSGKQERLIYRQSERAAVNLVSNLISDLEIDADTHSKGETKLAHRAKDTFILRQEIDSIKENYDVSATYHPKEELPQLGLGGAFHGGLTIPIGFGLNPRKYAAGLLTNAINGGTKVYGNTAVEKISKSNSGFNLRTQNAEISADRIILATNGYSSEDIPNWMRARFMPVQSSIIVTRPLGDQDLINQGWTSNQMAFDTRQLLHYFRLLPDKRFLFGMRGGLFSTPKEDRNIAQLIRRNFNEMFAAWKDVAIDYEWSGLACLNRSRLPFVGSIPMMKGAFAGFAYHGNGIAMGTYSGALLCELAMGQKPSGPYSSAMHQVPQRFPFGRYRRQVLRLIYQWNAWQDR